MLDILKRWLRDREREAIYQNSLIKDPLSEDPDELRMYVIVRSDVLPQINQGVQALHAVVEYGIHADEDSRFIEWAFNYKTVVILGGGPMEIGKACLKAHAKRIPFKEFYEPDLTDLMTAVAFEPMTRAAAKDLFWSLRRAE